MDLWYTAIKTFAMLCLVLGVLIAFLYALKRLTQKGAVNQGQIKLISAFSLGQRKQVMLLDVMQERMLLGVTADSINCLARYPQEKVEKQLETDMPQKNLQQKYRSENELFSEYENKSDTKQTDSEIKNVSQVQSRK